MQFCSAVLEKSKIALTPKNLLKAIRKVAAPPGGQNNNSVTPGDPMCNIKAVGQVVLEMKKF